MSCQRVLPDALPAGDTVVASHHLHIEPLPRLVGQARDFVVSHAPTMHPDVCDVLVLLTSELVTNAVLHARTEIEVGITVATRSVLVTVHDLDLTRTSQEPYTAREGGWGLELVSSLAQDSAMEPHPEGGKTAWFRLSRDGASAEWSTDSARRRGSEPAAGGTA